MRGYERDPAPQPPAPVRLMSSLRAISYVRRGSLNYGGYKKAEYKRRVNDPCSHDGLVTFAIPFRVVVIHRVMSPFHLPSHSIERFSLP